MPVNVQPNPLALTLTGDTPSVVVSDNIVVTPDALALSLAFATSTIGTGVNPDALSLALAFATPNV
ncbi:MAG: hypothetical protein PHS14_17725, partial [Elusimicrobia bacterium]|nr:hypothetical protein [Elusimicrobiota bacterium]